MAGFYAIALQTLPLSISIHWWINIVFLLNNMNNSYLRDVYLPGWADIERTHAHLGSAARQFTHWDKHL